MPNTLSHRERKKLKTRATIVRTAEELFLQNGFEETTIAEIAAAADVSPATVFNYFSSKDEILFSDYTDLQESLRSWLAARPPSQHVLESIEQWVISARRDLRDPEGDRLLRRVIDGSPILQATERLRMSYAERIIAEAVASDFGEAPDALRPRLIGAATTAVMLATLQHGSEEAAGANDPYALFHYAMSFLKDGYDALGRLESPAY